MKEIFKVVSLVLVTAVFACGGDNIPEETASRFLKCIQDSNLDGARKLLVENQWDTICDFYDDEIEIIGYSIEEVSLSEDGNSAEIYWKTTIIDANSPDTDEGGEWELEKDINGNWIIVDLFPN